MVLFDSMPCASENMAFLLFESTVFECKKHGSEKFEMFHENGARTILEYILKG